MIKILVNGANGRMGQLACEAIAKQKHLSLVGKAGRGDNLPQMIKSTEANVVVDFTVADSVFENTKTIIDAKAHPVIGTTGLPIEQVKVLQAYAETAGVGGALVPNFSIGAMVLNKLASMAATYFSTIEIVETHHDQKRDAPSGTAVQTAHLLANARKQSPQAREEIETLTGARGANFENIHIHALRLPGVMAKQTVYFGGPGETINIEHQVISREAYMPGVILACELAPKLNQLVFGLADLLAYQD